MAQSCSRTAKVLQFLGIMLNCGLLTIFGLWPMAVAVGVITIPAGIAACFD
ncbi:MAG: hypothetical protein WAW81_01270 [Minisyncoccia bacterium]